MGRNAIELLHQIVPTDVRAVRYWTDNIFIKEPKGHGSYDGPTPWHQDFQIGGGTVEDRVSKVNFWIALNDIPPERGSMRFFSGSQRLGILSPRDIPDNKTMVDLYPMLPEWCPISEPLHMRPGDATIHHPVLVHCAPQNTTKEARWSYDLIYIHPDARPNGVIVPSSEDKAREPLDPSRPFDRPIVYEEA
jgi:ectoine hydroxylase-related dioxygenase (phytanoyl-CoA dioxygenase family)